MPVNKLQISRSHRIRWERMLCCDPSQVGIPARQLNAIKLREIQRGAQCFSLLFLAMNAG